jgi:rhamnogalacturonyl hydrolase YesR
VAADGAAMTVHEEAQAKRVADWQLAKLAGGPAPQSPPPAVDRGWQQATFWIGMTALADHGVTWARDAVLQEGRTKGWVLGGPLYNADDYMSGQVNIWAAAHGAGGQALAPVRTRFDAILAAPPRVHLALYLGPEGYRAYQKAECLKRWCWADALFMGPPTWLALAKQTGDRRYRDYALSEFWASTNFLYDPAERLYFRDSRFFDVRDPQGRKVFWSRGNGWVFAALPRMMEKLPAADPERARLAKLFQEMAGRVKALQKPDGYWPSSLLAPDGSSPESSGTALFTYGLAWGVSHGLLKYDEYAPAARQGWSALESAVQPDGRLGWVQPAGDQPGPSTESGSQVYAAGAFLLAATAISDMNHSAK